MQSLPALHSSLRTARGSLASSAAAAAAAGAAAASGERAASIERLRASGRNAVLLMDHAADVAPVVAQLLLDGNFSARESAMRTLCAMGPQGARSNERKRKSTRFIVTKTWGAKPSAAHHRPAPRLSDGAHSAEHPSAQQRGTGHRPRHIAPLGRRAQLHSRKEWSLDAVTQNLPNGSNTCRSGGRLRKER